MMGRLGEVRAGRASSPSQDAVSLAEMHSPGRALPPHGAGGRCAMGIEELAALIGAVAYAAAEVMRLVRLILVLLRSNRTTNDKDRKSR